MRALVWPFTSRLESLLDEGGRFVWHVKHFCVQISNKKSKKKKKKKKEIAKKEMKNMPSNSSSIKQNKITYNRKYLTNMPQIIALPWLLMSGMAGWADAITASPTTPIKTWKQNFFFFFIFYYKMKQNEMFSYRK